MMSELSGQIMEGRLPLLPGWPGYEEAVTNRLKGIEDGRSYYEALTPGQLATVAKARRKDIFAGVCVFAQVASGMAIDSDPQRNWFLWQVDKHEGNLSWAVAAVQELADM